eukprot:1891665-Prymnesium_polylepis.1
MVDWDRREIASLKKKKKKNRSCALRTMVRSGESAGRYPRMPPKRFQVGPKGKSPDITGSSRPRHSRKVRSDRLFRRNHWTEPLRPSRSRVRPAKLAGPA